MHLSTATLLPLALLLPVFYALDSYIPTRFIFVPSRLQEIAQHAISVHGNDTEPLLRRVTQDLRTEYGADAVSDWSKEDFFFNNAGGAMVSREKPHHGPRRSSSGQEVAHR